MMKSKKAQTSIFETTLIIALLLVCVYSLFAFSGLKGKVETSFMAPAKLIDIYSEKENIEFYLEESGKLAASEAFYNVASKGAVSNAECREYHGYFIWEGRCNPSSENFIGFFNSSLANISGRKFDSRLENNKLTVDFENVTLNTSEKSNFVLYSVNYTFMPSIEIDLAKEGMNLDFKNVHSSALEKLRECKKVGNTLDCMNQFKADGWKTSVSSDGEYLLFDLSTEKRFFVNEDFQPIVLKFAL